MSTDFVPCNTLVPKGQRVLYKVCESSPEVCNADTKTLDAALAVIQDTKPSPKVFASPKHAAKSRCDTAKQSSFKNLPNSSVQECAPSKKGVFGCIVKEYDGTVSFEVISKRRDLFPNICEYIAKWFETRKQSFLVRKKKGTISQVSVPCRKARFCFKRKCSHSEPSEVKFLEYLSEEYDCSASLQVISKRKDLSPYEFQDVERERNATRLYIPGHWSQMPCMTRYQRVWLSPYSDEFELVEELFRNSIEQSVTIIRIERVQDPLMWEKYQRCVSVFTIEYTLSIASGM